MRAGGELAPGETTTLTVWVDTGTGLHQACNGGLFDDDPCLTASTWNGPASTAGQAEDDFGVVTERFALHGAAWPVAVLSGAATFEPGQPLTHRVDVSIAGTGPISDRHLVVDPREATATIEAVSTGWSCFTALSGGPQTSTRYRGVRPGAAICAWEGGEAAGQPVAPLEITFGGLAGYPDGCVENDFACSPVAVLWADVRTASEPVTQVPIAYREVPFAGLVDAPDLAPRLDVAEPVWPGRETTLLATVANRGAGATTGETTVALELPTGFAAQELGGRGWACELATLTCARTEPLPAGATAPAIRVTALVADDAQDGTAAATASTPGEADVADDRVERAVDVLAASAGSDPSRLSIRADGPGGVPRGGTAEVALTVENHGDVATEGPTTLTFAVPDGSAGGQRVAMTATGDGWACRAFDVRGTTQLRCTNRAGVPAGGGLPLTARVTAVDAVPGSEIVIPATLTGAQHPSADAIRLFVLQRTAPSITVAVGAHGPLVGGAATPLQIEVANRGRGVTTGPVEVEVPLPAGFTATGGSGSFWSCTPGGTARCTHPGPIHPGEGLSPLLLLVVAPAEAQQHVATVRARTAGALGPVSGWTTTPLTVEAAPAAVPTLRREGLGAPDGEGRQRYRLLVGNDGPTPMRARLELVEQLPAGATATVPEDSPWSCTQVATQVRCGLKDALATVPAGGQAPALDLTVTQPAATTSAPVTYGATVNVLYGGGQQQTATNIQPTTVAERIEHFEDLTLAFDVELRSEATTLRRGAPATLHALVTERFAPQGAEVHAVGFELPAGATEVSVTAPGTTGEVCGTRTTALRVVAACAVETDLAPNGDPLPVDVTFRVPDGAPRTITTGAGLSYDRGSAGPATILAATLDALEGSGVAALRFRAEGVHPVGGVVADAGPDQQAPEQAPGAAERTVVTLDGSASYGGTGALTHTWREVRPAGSPVPPAEWVTAPSGDRPRVRLPDVKGTAPVTLTFELTATDASTDGSTDATGTATDLVDVVVTPAENLAPSVGAITGGGAAAPGTTRTLTAAATDPDGDALQWEWQVVDSDAPAEVRRLTPNAADPARVEVTLPEGATYLVVEARVTDGYGGVDTATVTVGTPPPPIILFATGPEAPLAAGEPAALEAFAVLAPAGLTWRWEHVSGPAPDAAALAAAIGPTLTVPAPATAEDGAVTVLRAVAAHGTGAAARAGSALVTIPLQAAAAPTATVTVAEPRVQDQPIALTADATGPGPLTYAWRQVYGTAGTLSAATGQAVTFTAPHDGLYRIELKVTDALGRVVETHGVVVVGTPASAASGAACHEATSLIQQAIDAHAADGTLRARLGVIDLQLGSFTVTGACDTGSAQAAFAEGIATFGDLVTVTGVKGTITSGKTCITAGTASLPAELGLPSAQITTPVCIDTSGSAVTTSGAVTFTGLPYVTLPDDSAMDFPETVLSWGKGAATLTSTAEVANGSLSIAGELAFAGLPRSLTVTADQIRVLGKHVTLAGTITQTTSGTTYAVTGSLPGTVEVAPGLTLSSVDLAWNKDGVKVDGDLALTGPGITLAVKGAYKGPQKWSFEVAGKTDAGSWAAVPGLVIDPATFGGSIAHDGKVTFDVHGSLGGSWTPAEGVELGPLGSVPGGDGQLSGKVGLRLSNGTAPGACPTTTAGTVWLSVTGAATVRWGTAEGDKVSLDGEACVLPGSQPRWGLRTGLTLPTWAPAGSPDPDARLESFGFGAKDDGDGKGITVSGWGKGIARGLKLGIEARLRLADLGALFDFSGDLTSAGFGLPVVPPGTKPADVKPAIGHLVLATADFPEFRFPEATLKSVEGVKLGFSAHAGIPFPLDLRDFFATRLGLPDLPGLALSLDLLDGQPRFRGSIGLGDQGVTLFEDCPGEGLGCGDAERSALTLRKLSLGLTLAGGGRFDLAGEGRLHLPPALPGAQASTLDVAAALMVDLGTGPAVSLALSTANGTWHDALGAPGLDLADLAVVGGVDFGAPVPIPIIGVAATVERLPDDWAAAIGADPARQEPITFAANLSKANPIFQLSVGVRDQQPVLRPLAAAGMPDALVVDVASVVIAPLGGSIGAHTYAPGLSLDFASTILDSPVDVSARVSLTTPPSLDASLDIGVLPLQGFVLRDATADLHVGATGLRFAADGRITLPVGNASLAGSVDLTANIADGFRLDVHAAATGWELSPFVLLDQLEVDAHAALPGLAGGAPALAFAASGSGRIGGVRMGLAGSLAFDGGGVKAVSLEARTDSFNAGALRIGGQGCDGPAGPLTGPCLRVAYDRDQPSPFSGAISGSVDLAGFGGSVDGTFDRTGIALAARLGLGPVGFVDVDGRLWLGDDLAGITATGPDGVARQVQKGDALLSAGLQTATLAGFSADVRTLAGRLGGGAGSTFVQVDGQLHLGGGQVSGRGLLAVTNGNVTYDFAGDGDLTISGHRLASAHVRATNIGGTRVELDGKVAVPGVGTSTPIFQADLAGRMTASPFTFDLTGSTSVHLVGVNAATAVRLQRTSAGVTSLKADVDLTSTIFRTRVGVDVASTGRFCGWGATSFDFGLRVDGSLRFGNQSGCEGLYASLSVAGGLNVSGHVNGAGWALSGHIGPLWAAAETSPVDIWPFGWTKLGASFRTEWDVTISSSQPVQISGSGSAAVWAQNRNDDPKGTLWKDIVRLEVGVSVETNPRRVCATVPIVDQKICS